MVPYCEPMAESEAIKSFRSLVHRAREELAKDHKHLENLSQCTKERRGELILVVVVVSSL